MSKPILLTLALSLFLGCQTSTPDSSLSEIKQEKTLPHMVTILPWNGYRGALSLTFDDGDPSQETEIREELDKRDIKATFNITVYNVIDGSIWRQAVENGHEVSNHSWNHRRPQILNHWQMNKETEDARKQLEEWTRQRIWTFAYPYSQTTPGMKDRIAEQYTAARGGQHPPLIMRPGRVPDWTEIPSFVVRSRYPANLVLGWKESALETGGWCILMFHALEGAKWGWEPYPRKEFERILDDLAGEEDLWLAPFGTVAAYWRAQTIVERGDVITDEKGFRIHWMKPETIPPSIQLKAIIQPGWEFWQDGKPVINDNKDFHWISFDSEELIIIRTPTLSEEP